MSSATTHLPVTGVRRDAGHYGPRPRIGALLHRGRLDRMLADGADPSSSRELELRTRQITRPAYRRSLADSFEKALAMAERPRLRLSSAVMPASRELRASRVALLELCRALREPVSVEPAGVALALLLLTDGTGPLYIESRNDALWYALRKAAVALDGRT